MLNREQLIHYAQSHGAQKAQALQYQQVRNVIRQQAALATGSIQAALLDLDRLFATLSQRYPLSYVQEMIVMHARRMLPSASTDEIRAMYHWVIEQLVPLPPVPVPSFRLQQPRPIATASFWVILVEKGECHGPLMQVRGCVESGTSFEDAGKRNSSYK
jgi:hypothetical protein